MRRLLLLGLFAIWSALILACTGAGGKWFDLPDGYAIYRCDYRTYSFSNNAGGASVSGHITEVGFDDRFILLRRDVCNQVSRKSFPGRYTLTFELTGKVEFYIVEVSPVKRHGPFTEEEFDAARERLGVPAELELEATDKVRSRLPRARD